MGPPAVSVAPFATREPDVGASRVPWRVAAQRAALVLAVVVGAPAAFGLGIATLVTQHQRVCSIERERAGFGRAQALAALDNPRAAVGFHYRAVARTDDYEAKVMVMAGRFLGDTWQRDAHGRVTHAVDLCRAELPPLLLQVSARIPLDVTAPANGPGLF